MNGKKMAATSVAALFLLLAGFGLAAAQDDNATDNQTTGDQGAANGQQGDLSTDAEMPTAEACGASGEGDGGPFQGNAAQGVADARANSRMTQVQERNVDIDEETVFNALALARNGAGDISFNELANIDAVERSTRAVDWDAGYDQDTVFSALALGVNADGGELEALACVSQVRYVETQEQRVTQRVNLDRQDTLLAIALSNSAGSDLDWREIADITRTETQQQNVDRDVNIETEDTFLALALGLGGSDQS